MSHLKIWRDWGRCLVYGVATIYDVALQRLYGRRRVRLMTFGDVVCSGVFSV